MLSLAKWVYLEFHPLIVKMHVNNQWSDVVRKNLKSLCDVEVILGLPCILLLLKCVHVLIKVAQGRNVFVCDFMEVVKGPNKSFIDCIVTHMPNLRTQLLMISMLLKPLPIPTS
jgi:hypothetical protein